jgi:hypothetical protein
VAFIYSVQPICPLVVACKATSVFIALIAADDSTEFDKDVMDIVVMDHDLASIFPKNIQFFLATWVRRVSKSSSVWSLISNGAIVSHSPRLLS